ncbi:hypothetical protein [Pedobacter metabolipauper]|uniref:Uncharacterized protein n=1 Tax=Pedobacter metabolipauper TaxID=425513 RepID=A0A4R6SXM6_9SPHI|nr:hypothetical protein [Pedobacter metabolipauper]TDQ09225.1 hypothetical protein ATK78_1379 [Pedobacter metabolipauper]
MKLIKIINLLLVALMLNYKAISQEISNLKDIISFSLPKGAKKISILGNDSSELKEFKDLDVKLNDKKIEYYTIDKALLRLNASGEKVKSNLLEERKESLDQLFIEYSGYYKSELKVIVNTKFLVLQSESKRSVNGKLTFYGVNRANDKLVSGVLCYKKTERASILKTLASILENINFRK